MRSGAGSTWPILLVGIGSLSAGSIFARLAAAPPVWTACLRCAFAVALLGVLALRTRPVWPRRDLRLALLSGALLALHLATWIASLEMTTVAVSLLFVSTAPIWALVLGAVLGLEKPVRRQVAACGVAFCGASALAASAWSGSAGSGLGVGLAAISGVSFGAYLLCGKARCETCIQGYVLASYLSAAGLLGLGAASLGQVEFGLEPASWGWIVAMAVGSQLIGHTTINWAVPRVGATAVGIGLLLEPVIASLLALAIFAERVGAWTLAAGICVLIGVGLVLTSKPDPTAVEPPK